MSVTKMILLLTILAVIGGWFIAYYCPVSVDFVFLVFRLNDIGIVPAGAIVYAARNEESLQVLEHSIGGGNQLDEPTISRETHGGVVTLTEGRNVYFLDELKSRGYLTTKVFVKNGKYRWSVLLVPDKYASSIQYPGLQEYP